MTPASPPAADIAADPLPAPFAPNAWERGTLWLLMATFFTLGGCIVLDGVIQMLR